METCYKTSLRGSACFCVKCKQGVLTKAQYTDQIRVLCSRSKTSRTDRNDNESAMRKSPRKTNTQTDDLPKHDVKLVEETITTSQFNGPTNDRYYVDEEQPTDLYSYNLMVNGRLADPRILPAVVDTITYLRTLYHKILMQTKRASSYVYDQKNNSFGSKGSDSYSSDDLSGSDFPVNKPQLFEKSSVSTKRLVEKNTSLPNKCTNSKPYGKLRKKRMLAEEGTEQFQGETGRDSDSGVHFDCDASESSNNENTRLHEAARIGDVEKVIQLILDCCDVNGLNNDGWPAIESALSRSKFRAALFLIEAGTDIKSYTGKKVDEYEEALRRVRNQTYFIRTAV